MGEHSKIEWTDHTASPWYGCEKVAEGCKNCYAAAMAKRNPTVLGEWGPDGQRPKSKSFLKNLERWNAQAEKTGKPASVFPSWCDPFEDRPDVEEWRREMFDAADRLPWIRLLLLTKRPENILKMWPGVEGNAEIRSKDGKLENSAGHFRKNVWLGTSVSVQSDADQNIPELLKCRDLTLVLFVSAEPLLESIELAYPPSLFPDGPRTCCNGFECGCMGGPIDPPPWFWPEENRIDWVIVGGESGHGARPMHPNWARSIRNQCTSANVPFFFKQWGEWLDAATVLQRKLHGTHVEYVGPDKLAVRRVGKKAAGRMLDGREWSEFPEVNT